MNTYMAWVGQNATTGQPHPITGRMSKWGDLYIFKSKKSRDEFCGKWDNINNVYPVPTNRKEAKVKYFAGMTQHKYDMMIDTADWYE